MALVRSEPRRRERLHELVAVAGRKLEARCGLIASGSQIQPVIVGDDAAAMALAAAMQRQGFDIRAVRPPTVPEGTARLRISITLNAGETAVDHMIDALAGELGKSAA